MLIVEFVVWLFVVILFVLLFVVVVIVRDRVPPSGQGEQAQPTQGPLRLERGRYRRGGQNRASPCGARVAAATATRKEKEAPPLETRLFRGTFAVSGARAHWPKLPILSCVCVRAIHQTRDIETLNKGALDNKNNNKWGKK